MTATAAEPPTQHATPAICGQASAELTRLAHEVVEGGREFVQCRHEARRSTKEATKAIVQRKDAIVALRDKGFKVTERSKGVELTIVIDGVVFTGYWKDFRKTYLGGVSDRHIRRLLGDKPEKKQREKVVRIKVGDTVVIADEVKETRYEVVSVPEEADGTASIALRLLSSSAKKEAAPKPKPNFHPAAPKAQKIKGTRLTRDSGREIVSPTPESVAAARRKIAAEEAAGAAV